MKKRFLAGVSIFMAAILLGTVAACGIPYYYVDENDLSRWIVEFTCDYPSDLPPNGVKYSIQALKEMNLNGNDSTINIPYDPVYEEMGLADFSFTLEPKTEFYYVDDNGREKELSNLRLEKDYYFMRDILYEVDESDGELHHTQRIFRRGIYYIDYAFGTELTAADTPINTISKHRICIIVKNVEEY